MATKYLDENGLLYFWQKIKNLFVTDVTYNSTSKKIQKTKAGSTSDVVTLSTVATSGSYNDLSNKPTIPDGVEKTSTTPKMDGTAAIGSETKFAAGDHVHPSDTSRVPTTRKVNGKALSSDITLSASDVGALPDDTTIPSKVSDLTNDSGFLTSESDPTVPSWAKASSKPSYTANEVGAIPTSAKGAASGVCPLNASSKIDTTYLPSYVDDVVEAYPRSGQTELSQNWLSATSGGSALTPETGKIYVLMADSTNYAANTQFRWGGTAYVKLADGGVTSITNSEIDTIVAS